MSAKIGLPRVSWCRSAHGGDDSDDGGGDDGGDGCVGCFRDQQRWALAASHPQFVVESGLPMLMPANY